tara:strand:+ start:72 stop:521 length:450 start_codon:yes stop_codon:yes gene_type:complete
MLKKFLFLIILTLSVHNYVKADFQEFSSDKRNLNKTTCTWKSSQFTTFDSISKLNNRKSDKDSIRYCVDYKNNTVYSFKNTNKLSSPKRVNGFLNSGEITDSGLGYYFIYQFEIEDNQLVRYSCMTSGPNSKGCTNNEKIGKWIYGIKR